MIAKKARWRALLSGDKCDDFANSLAFLIIGAGNTPLPESIFVTELTPRIRRNTA